MVKHITIELDILWAKLNMQFDESISNYISNVLTSIAVRHVITGGAAIASIIITCYGLTLLLSIKDVLPCSISTYIKFKNSCCIGNEIAVEICKHIHTYIQLKSQNLNKYMYRVASMSVWNDKMVRHQAASVQVSVDSAFTWSSWLCNAYRFCSWNVWILQHHSVHALDMSSIKVFVYLGLQFKWNQLSPNNSRHTSCLHKGLHAGSGRSLNPQVHDDATHPVVSQWQSGVNLHNGNTLEDHWKLTGNTLATKTSYPSGIPIYTAV